VAGGFFYGGPVARREEEKCKGGPRVQRRVEGKMGKKEGAREWL
jgi:hypothetical protein